MYKVPEGCGFIYGVCSLVDGAVFGGGRLSDISSVLGHSPLANVVYI